MTSPKPMLANIEEAGIETIAARLSAKTVVRPETGCLEWQGKRDPKGYGYIKIGKTDYRAHRVAMVLARRQDLPANLMVCHTCDNPPCLNIEHLWLGTAADNSRDMAEKGRHADFRGEGNPRAKLSADDVRAIRSDPRGYKRLAKAYGLHRTTIQDIRRGINWGSIA